MVENGCLLMTVGELSARTGLSAKVIRELEGRGLIYSAGRSASNYRLFDESALWCAATIRNLRTLGLTIKEIEKLADRYLGQPEDPIGPHLARLLDMVEHRIVERVEELQGAGRRLQDFRKIHALALAGAKNHDFATSDPRWTAKQT